jgi:type VI secretion system secreted protein VgrG
VTVASSQNLAPPRYAFACSDVPHAQLHVRRFTLVEELSAPYRLAIELITADLDIDVSGLLGASCELRIDRDGAARSLLGVVEQVRELPMVANRLRFALEVVPAFALLEQVVDTRFFQGMSAAQILEQVLKAGLAAYGRRARLELVGAGTTVREYCVQFRESDHEFAARLMEEEGITYRFEHPGGGDAEVMVLVGNTSQCGELDRSDGATIDLIDRATASDITESFDGFMPRYALRSTSVAQADFDWKSPSGSPYRHERRVPDLRGSDREVYEHDDRRLHADDGAARARRKQEQRAVQTRVFLGTSDVAELVPGVTFRLRGHPHAALDRKYLLVRVRHVGEAPEEMLHGGEGREQVARYSNECECIEAERPWRPAPLHPKQRARGLQTAIVVGPGSEEIHTDEFGRVKVRFHWDRHSPFDDTASCWIRVGQQSGGAGYGSVVIPRVGSEVLVEFLDGDPDRPIVIGCVYNGDIMPPYPLPEGKSRTTMKSDSTPGGGGFNEVRFEDSKGSEEIFIHAQKDMYTKVLHDSAREVDNDDSDAVTNNQDESVGVDRTASVGNNESLRVGMNQDRKIGGDQSTAIASNQRYTVGGGQDVVVGGDRTLSVTGHHLTVAGMDQATVVGGSRGVQVFGTDTLEVALDRTTTILGSETSTVSVDRVAKIVGAGTVNVGTNLAGTVGADAIVAIGANISASVGAHAQLVVAGERVIQVGANDTLVVAGELMITAPTITLSSGGATITLSGANIDISGGLVSINGALVEVNS